MTAETVELELVETTALAPRMMGPAVLPEAQDIVTPSGKISGKRYCFHEGGMKVSEIRRHLRATTELKGRALSNRVTEILKDGVELKKMGARIFLEGEFAKGKVPDSAESRNKSAKLSLVDPGEVKEVKASQSSSKANTSQSEALLKEKDETIAGLEARLMELEELVSKKN